MNEENQNGSSNQPNGETTNGQKRDWQVVGKTVLIIIGLAILGYLGWFLYKFITEENKSAEVSTTQSTPTQPACESTLTDADKSAIVGWKTYTNGNAGYEFKYPQTWWISRASQDYVILKENESKIEFSFKSGANAVPVSSGYTLGATNSIQIACETATIKSYEKQPNLKLLIASFVKDGKNFVIQQSYPHQGASISGDIQDSWDIILKSIEFK